MVPPYSSVDDRVVVAPRGGRIVAAAFSVVGVGALVAALIAALSLWVLLTDPGAAGPLAESGDVTPLARALLAAVGRALATLLSYL